MSKAARRALGTGLALITGLGYAGCAATGTDSGLTSHPTQSDAGSTSSDAGSGGDPGAPLASSGKGGMSDINTNPDAAGAGGTPDDSCAADVSKAEVVPLDMYIMLDVSGSMLDTTSTYDNMGKAISKWSAVKAALEGFITADTSSGLGVGLQYFPVLKPNIPATCTTNADCGSAAPCAFSACAITEDVCEQNSECPSVGFGNSNACTPVGTCGGLPCIGAGGQCLINDALVDCVALTTSYCAHPAVCDTASYASPAQPIAALPGAAAALVGSIEAQTPLLGSPTPTGPALNGAITQATTQAKAHPDHQVVAVLVTDGIPSECTPVAITDVAKIAAAGAAATPKINTFTIGVFATAEVAQGQAALNSIAKSGGTGSAFVVNTSNDVASQFRDALDNIRSTQLGCDFQIPAAKPGQNLDYSLVNVNFKTGKTSSALYYVGSVDQCDPLSGGWYYDTDPTLTDPSQIEVCPTTCTTFRSASNASVDIAVGCQTIVK